MLISPDIPAETLLSDRANFLAPSLKRFREAYLFSNEGDEVLRMISPIVNYFSFPTKDRKYGYRLGNVEILNKNYPDRCPTTDNNVSPKLLEMLRVGSKKLIELCHEPSDDNEIENTHCDNPADIAKMFTYIDCTDYIDGKDMRGMLTYAKNMKKDDAEACLTWIDHLKLLLGYILNKVNVHGGYFEGEQSQRLIYRLACLGWEKTLEVYGFEEQRINYPKLSGQTASWLIDNEVIAYQILGIRRLIKLTKEHQVRVLLSPYLSADLDKILANEPGKDDIDTYFPINISSQSTIHPPYIEEDEDWLVIGGARIQKHPVI